MPLSAHLSSLLHSKIARSVTVLASGAAGAQAVSMLSAPITTRLYGPEAYGLCGVFVSYLGVIASLAAMMYPMALTLPKKDREALTIIRLSLAVALIVSFTFLLVLLFSASWLAEASGAEAVQNYFYLLPLASLTTAWSQIASQWLVDRKSTRLNSSH